MDRALRAPHARGSFDVDVSVSPSAPAVRSLPTAPQRTACDFALPDHAIPSEVRAATEREWFHGTRVPFVAFTDRRGRSTPTSGAEINVYLGHHFSAERRVARLFALGLYRRSPARVGEPVAGRVITVRAPLAGVPVFAGEHQLELAVTAHAIRAGVLTDAALRAELPRLRRRQGSSVHWIDLAMEKGHSLATCWGRDLYDVAEVLSQASPVLMRRAAQAFVRALRAAGHHGLVYDNTFEGGWAAIVFDGALVDWVDEVPYPNPFEECPYVVGQHVTSARTGRALVVAQVGARDVLATSDGRAVRCGNCRCARRLPPRRVVEMESLSRAHSAALCLRCRGYL